MLGPGFTYFRTRNVRARTEEKAQSILNEFIKQERHRADRLEQRLDDTLNKLNAAEDEVSQLRLRLSEAQSDLDQVPMLKRQVRKLMRRVTELEANLRAKESENESLRLEIARRESKVDSVSDNTADIESSASEQTSK